MALHRPPGLIGGQVLVQICSQGPIPYPDLVRELCPGVDLLAWGEWHLCFSLSV